jgi:CMP-2-keto-3-deoxyoctulosonic acid synthetase
MFSGFPMIEHVWRRAQLTDPVIETVIATDSEEIKKVCENFGAKCYITSKEHPNGLSRVSEISSILNWDFYIVLQADEILIDPEYLNKLHNLENIVYEGIIINYQIIKVFEDNTIRNKREKNRFFII